PRRGSPPEPGRGSVHIVRRRSATGGDAGAAGAIAPPILVARGPRSPGRGEPVVGPGERTAARFKRRGARAGHAGGHLVGARRRVRGTTRGDPLARRRSVG